VSRVVPDGTAAAAAIKRRDGGPVMRRLLKLRQLGSEMELGFTLLGL